MKKYDLDPSLTVLPASNLFIRHSRLKPPYDDYNLLSFDELCRLAAREVEPDVHPDSRSLARERLPAALLQDLTTIVHSPAKRAEDSGRLVETLAGRPIRMVEEDDLAEIEFDLRQLLSPEEFERGRMEVVRPAVFEGMLTGKHVESLRNQFARVDRLIAKYGLNDVRTRDGEKTLFITHSFFMRAIQLYLLHKGQYQDFSVSDLLEMVNYSNWTGFFIAP